MFSGCSSTVYCLWSWSIVLLLCIEAIWFICRNSSYSWGVQGSPREVQNHLASSCVMGTALLWGRWRWKKRHHFQAVPLPQSFLCIFFSCLPCFCTCMFYGSHVVVSWVSKYSFKRQQIQSTSAQATAWTYALQAVFFPSLFSCTTDELHSITMSLFFLWWSQPVSRPWGCPASCSHAVEQGSVQWKTSGAAQQMQGRPCSKGYVTWS